MFLITYDTRIFSAPKSHFSDKRLCPWNKFTMEKIFKIDIFVLVHVMVHSKSIPTKKPIFENFSIFWSFFAVFGQNPDLSIFGERNFFTHFKRIVRWSFCAITCILTSFELCWLSRFFEFLTKNGQQ